MSPYHPEHLNKSTCPFPRVFFVGFGWFFFEGGRVPIAALAKVTTVSKAGVRSIYFFFLIPQLAG